MDLLPLGREDRGGSGRGECIQGREEGVGRERWPYQVTLYFVYVLTISLPSSSPSFPP